MLAQDALGNKAELFIFTHFNLRFGVQIDHQQLRPVLLENEDASLFLAILTTLEKF